MPMDLTAVLAAHKADVEEAVRLEEEEAPKDPEEAPYRSQYAARELLNKVLDALPTEAESDLRAVTAALTVRVGVNLCDTGERPEGEARLLHALALCREGLTAGEGEALYLSTLMHALNTLGRLFSDRADNEQALLWLAEAERQYKLHAEDGPVPVSFSALLRLGGAEPGDADERRRFEAVYTRTLYYMAQVHCKLPKHAAIAAWYCGATLSRQLAEGEYEALDWALNAGALSQFFLTRQRFETARYCLASAEAMFREQILPAEKQKEEEGDGSEKELQGRADLHRCWAKYGLYLLDPTTETEEREEDDEEEGRQMDQSALKFDTLQTIAEHEAEVGCERPDGMEKARPYFLFVQRHLEAAKQFYTLDSHCSDHVAVVQDHSRAFRLLADFYEFEVDRQCRMHKRRVDMLKALLDCLNPQHFLLLCRQLLFECGETLQSMVTAKTSALSVDMPKKEMAHAMKKINTICKEGISFYDRFLKSFARPDGSMPEEFAADETRPMLLSHFHTGHLNSKLLDTDKGRRIANIEASIRAYQAVIDYCDRVPAARDTVPDELPLCREMVQLLPGKIRKIALEN